MGGDIRAKQLRLSTRQRVLGRHRRSLARHQQDHQVDTGCRHLRLLRQHQPSGPTTKAPRHPVHPPMHSGMAESRSHRYNRIPRGSSRNTTRGRDYTSYKVANFLVEFSTSIPRTQLRPSYGDGFLGAPLQSRQLLENPAPREQGDQRGSSSTPRQQNSGGAHHI